MNIKETVSEQNRRPIRVVQFGEGNFLRAFVDYMIDIANEKGVMDAGIAIVKPISFGSLAAFAEQDDLYTVILRGKENGRVAEDTRVITAVSKTLDCETEYDDFMALARLDTLRFAVSNTTEAGIVLDETDTCEGLPRTYPGKLTKFLYERYTAFNGAADKGLIILPVELIAMGGSAVLTEVHEMFGAETLLMNRCRTEKEFNKTVAMINGVKQYFMRYGEKVDENPSPGNKAGGITTLEDKSLGCVQKGGTAPVEDVLAYGEAVKRRGLSLLYAPGNDPVAANALAASGAQIILFTTGRGTPFGCPVPTAKISSNTALAEKKKTWIDFNAGALLEGKPMTELAEEFTAFVLALASGEQRAKAESLDRHELAIFKDGVTL